MRCPYCGAVDSKVIDSTRYLRVLSCKKRFTTYEIVETCAADGGQKGSFPGSV